jgi:hypothetical protein
MKLLRFMVRISASGPELLSIGKTLFQYINFPMDVRHALFHGRKRIELLVRLSLIPVCRAGKVVSSRVGMTVFDPAKE